MTETEAKQLINDTYPDSIDGETRPGDYLDTSMPFNTDMPQIFNKDYAGHAIFNVAHQQAFSNDKALNEKITALADGTTAVKEAGHAKEADNSNSED